MDSLDLLPVRVSHQTEPLTIPMRGPKLGPERIRTFKYPTLQNETLTLSPWAFVVAFSLLVRGLQQKKTRDEKKEEGGQGECTNI